MGPRDQIFWKFGKAALETSNLTSVARKQLFEDAKRELELDGTNSEKQMLPETVVTRFDRFVMAALTGVCASHSNKFDCQNRLEIARTAIGIAQHVIKEIEEIGGEHAR